MGGSDRSQVATGRGGNPDGQAATVRGDPGDTAVEGDGADAAKAAGGEVGADASPTATARHRVFSAAELREIDPQLQQLTEADMQLISVLGDTIHQNDGTHLDGRIGVKENGKWQCLYRRVVAVRNL